MKQRETPTIRYSGAWRGAAIGVALVTGITVSGTEVAHAAVVSASNPTWALVQETASGTGAFVTGPATPPSGTGSVQLTTDASGGMAVIGAAAHNGTKLSQITGLAYSTYKTSGAAAVAVTLQLNVDYDVTDGNTGWQGRLVFEPYNTGATVLTGTWQDWNTIAATGKWWASGAPGSTYCPIGSPCTWNQVLTHFPNAGIHPTLGAIVLKAGSGWGVFDGNADLLRLSISGKETVYDFEPTAPAQVWVDDDWQSSPPATFSDPDGAGPATSYGIDAYPTVQEGIDSVAAPGGVVSVYPGTYDEQLAITTNGLTIAAEPGTLIRPTTVVSDATQGSPCSGSVGTAIVLVSGVTGVTLNNIHVDGSLAAAQDPPRFVGIYYRNASGAINGGAVTDIRNDPLDGTQGGVGIYAQASGPNTATLDVDGVTVSGYQKNGVTFNGCGCANAPDGIATGSVRSSTITGAGATSLIAQNGVQVGFGAGPVTIEDNVIGGNRYTGNPNNGTGSGILIFSAKNNTLTQNSVADNNNGIVFAGGDFGLCAPADATGNSATCNIITGHDAFSYEAGVLSDTALNSVTDNSITGNAIGIDASAISVGTLDAEDNWWGCAGGPGNPGCDTVVGSVNSVPFLSAPPACLACTQDSDCDDGVACNGAEACTGTCAPGLPVTCASDGNPCTSDVCVEPSGSCPYMLLPNGSACTGGTCQSGLCSVAGLSVGYASLRTSGLANKDRFRLRGEVDATTLPSFADDVDTNGVTIVVESSAGVVDSVSFTGAQCTLWSGGVKCKDPTSRSSIRFRNRSAPSFFRVRIIAYRRSFTLPSVAQTPLTVRLQTPATSTERSDPIVGCSAVGSSGLRCRDNS